MFNNLIESSSHRSEMKRRGSFFLFTVAGYALLMVVAGVASIYAYDARLEEQNTEISFITFAPPAIQDEPARQPASERQNPSSTNSSAASRPTRPVLYDRPDNPTNPPESVGTVAPLIPPAPHNAIVGPIVTDPPGSGNRVDFGSASGGVVVEDIISDPPPKPVTPRATPQVIKSSVVLNGKALDLPKPPYPPTARLIRQQGKVNVQVLIDETGQVVSARAIEGPPLLKEVSEKAAYQARFSPTKLGDQPVKVSGVITYNFVLQ